MRRNDVLLDLRDLRQYLRRKRKRRRRLLRQRRQRGGAVVRPTLGAPARPHTTLTDKIAQGVSMFLAGDAPTFATLGKILAAQLFKGIKDNVDYYND